MLDRAHAGEHRVAHALVAVPVAQDAAAQAPRGVHDGADLARVVDLHARVLLRQAGALGRARLDAVDAAGDVDAARRTPGPRARARRPAAPPTERARGSARRLSPRLGVTNRPAAQHARHAEPAVLAERAQADVLEEARRPSGPSSPGGQRQLRGARRSRRARARRSAPAARRRRRRRSRARPAPAARRGRRAATTPRSKTIVAPSVTRPESGSSRLRAGQRQRRRDALRPVRRRRGAPSPPARRRPRAAAAPAAPSRAPAALAAAAARRQPSTPGRGADREVNSPLPRVLQRATMRRLAMRRDRRAPALAPVARAEVVARVPLGSTAEHLVAEPDGGAWRRRSTGLRRARDRSARRRTALHDARARALDARDARAGRPGVVRGGDGRSARRRDRASRRRRRSRCPYGDRDRPGRHAVGDLALEPATLAQRRRRGHGSVAPSASPACVSGSERSLARLMRAADGAMWSSTSAASGCCAVAGRADRRRDRRLDAEAVARRRGRRHVVRARRRPSSATSTPPGT